VLKKRDLIILKTVGSYTVIPTKTAGSYTVIPLFRSTIWFTIFFVKNKNNLQDSFHLTFPIKKKKLNDHELTKTAEIIYTVISFNNLIRNFFH